MDDPTRTLRRGVQIGAWGLLLFVAFATLSPISLRPETGHVTLERFGAYALTAGAFTVGYPRRWPLVAIALLAAASLLEALQTLEPDRHGHLRDVLVKSSGVLAGVVAGLIALQMVSQLVGARSERRERKT